MNEEIAIRVESVSKFFKLPHEKNSSIKSIVVNFWRRNKSYELQKALEDVSFEVKKGEFFGIVGRNGSGKSTLLKLLAGIYTPDIGSIHVNGKLTPFIELGVGFSPELTGRENVFLNGALLGFSRKEMEAMYDDIVDFAELEKFMDQKLKNYSSGMHVRLAFSIAVKANTDILLLDEVLAVGDAAFQQKCFDYFLKLRRDKQTVVFISHDMEAVRRFCTRVAYIKDGELLAIGDPPKLAQMYTNENFAQIVKNDKKASHKESRLPVSVELSIVGSSTINVGDPVKVKVKIIADKSHSVVISASVFRDNVYVGGFNTKKYKEPIVLKKGENDFNFIIKTNSLNEGSYYIGSGVFERGSFKPLGDLRDGPRISIEKHNLYSDGLASIDGEIVRTSNNKLL
ncbi:MAG TPA: ABC transporter ATP-binding protein [Candidatus Saccharimonadales bacterium]